MGESSVQRSGSSRTPLLLILKECTPVHFLSRPAIAAIRFEKDSASCFVGFRPKLRPNVRLNWPAVATLVGDRSRGNRGHLKAFGASAWPLAGVAASALGGLAA